MLLQGTQIQNAKPRVKNPGLSPASPSGKSGVLDLGVLGVPGIPGALGAAGVPGLAAAHARQHKEASTLAPKGQQD